MEHPLRILMDLFTGLLTQSFNTTVFAVLKIIDFFQAVFAYSGGNMLYVALPVLAIVALVYFFRHQVFSSIKSSIIYLILIVVMAAVVFLLIMFAPQ